MNKYTLHFLVLASLLVSCAISTGMVSQRPEIQDTTVSYVDAPKASPSLPKQVSARDSFFRSYIGSIIKPFIDDSKAADRANSSNLVLVIREQGKRIDSLNTQRRVEMQAYEFAAVQRDSTTRESILKDKRIDALQSVLQRIDQQNVEANDLAKSMSKAFRTFTDIMLFIAIGYAVLWTLLTLVYLVRKPRAKVYGG